LAGAIVEVWVALCLNWACELPLKNYYFSGLIYEMVNCLVGVILKCSIFQISKKSALVNHVT